ncbi:hypothetical protein I6H88_14460 [Elizabethkingia bruuniana]|uniref:Fibrobacter succinogenes major paralogous domain-containing protein n=1 Tax=Elizabethkingia bruuniana TaxID=1756149 RepID=A0A7T7ZWG1_9FLAO|nr:FISUMP domain-containing protein [Elizabethkingia bruuniana]AQX84145.1 hypothetical protein AYC65_03530 [Elizabethkingia bruuniana]KUY28322.1 hypothetical protein ATB97_15525 [Elizabethkingia bruuniana]OPB64563.1 hypothetical protein BAY12_07170 [Elizabethkingia bruuniana]QDZ63144.1 hypothetical protein EVD20_11510 [Elizabethkingia bruuniana]QQN57641.1 hypothetical protein I6H88_14460 [Elizabethkingia bruuniana]
MKNRFYKIKAFLFVLLITVTACRNSDTDHHLGNEPVAVKMNMKGTEYNDAGNLGSLASSGKSAGIGLSVQRQNIQLTKDLVLTAELVPDTASAQDKAKTLRNGITAVETGDLAMGVLYKVVVFDANGNYVTERDYTRGQEDSAQALMLDGGSSYTFIVYSVNNSSTADLPSVTFSNPNNKTLATSSVTSPILFASDVMYFRRDMIVSGSGTNYLDIVLKHKMSQVITTVDASSTGYTISDINARIGNSNTGASMQLSDGNITRSGGTSQTLLSFTGLNTMIVKSNPRILNTDTTTGNLFIYTITIGSVTRSNLTLNNLTIRPGVKYNLNVTINPTDIYLTYQGQSAARINGRIWMRHTLGATTSNDPDVPSQAIAGNYYQWGIITAVATASTGAGTIPGWNTTNPSPANAWNSGTVAAPVKTSADPCPAGYRIPTDTEFNQLIAATTQTNIGTWTATNDVNNFSAAKVFTSNTNSSVKMTFMSTGYRRGGGGGDTNDGSLNRRGVAGQYWTSVNQINYFMPNNTVSRSINTNIEGHQVRCIAQ